MNAFENFIFFVICVFGLFGCMHSDKSNANNTDINKVNSGTDSFTTARAALQTSTEDCKKLNGSIFRYKEPEELSDLPDRIPDSLLHTIIFRCENDSVKALMFGPDPEGEHGMFYFKTNLDSIQVNNDLISFSMKMDELYWKPYTLNNYNKGIKYEVQGGSNERQFFKGKLAGDSIVFTCDSDGDCYGKTMVFKKISPYH